MENIQNEETVESLAAEFNSCGELLKEHCIRRGKAASRAKSKGKNDFEEFCGRINYKPTASTPRKYVKIGIEADWLELIIAHLPTENWTTIYDVAVLGKAKAQELIGRGVLNTQATAKQLKEAIAEAIVSVAPESDPAEETSDETNHAQEPCIFQVDASDLSDHDRIALFHALEREASPHGLRVTGLPDRLTEQLIGEREAA